MGVGGTALTTANANVWITGVSISSSLWYLDSLSTATQTLYTLYGASQSRIGVGMLSLTGCNSSSLGGVATNSASTYGSGSTVSVTTASANSMVVSATNFNSTGASSATGTNQTQRYNGNIQSDHGLSGSSQTTTTTGSYTSSYTWVGAAGGWVISAMEVKAAGGATVNSNFLAFM